MTCNITSTPLIDPLPIYTCDPETSSVRSAAPSYISEVPPYTETDIPHAPSSPTQRTGLPSPRYAEGFQNRAHGSVSDMESHNFNVSHWSSINASHASRQYQNVAARRAINAGLSASASLAAAFTTAAPPGPSSPTASAPNAAQSSSNPSSGPSDADILSTSLSNPTLLRNRDSSTPPEPLNPLEDPDLVGEAAATRARNARIYRETILRGDDPVRHEGKTWDFMLAQMADWEERERSWANFRREVYGGQSRGSLVRRLGL